MSAPARIRLPPPGPARLLAVAAAVAVLVYELRDRSRSLSALAPQDVVRLMNQGAALLDVRGAEAFAAGPHPRRAQPPGRRLAEGRRGAQALQGQAGRGLLRSRRAAARPHCAQLPDQGFKQVVNLRGRAAMPGGPSTCRWRATGRGLARLGRARMLRRRSSCTANSWCPYCERARSLLRRKGVQFDGDRLEAAAAKRAPR